MRSFLMLSLTIVLVITAQTFGLSRRMLPSAPGFTLKDIEGKEVSLSDFKGKVIYLDIWASWCAPCIAEINKAKKVKEHFKNEKDLVFLYISIDKDDKRWKETVRKKDITGVHLISKGGEEEGILQKYDVPAIPKFVLIDRNGDIVFGDAKPPSDPDLIADLETALKK